jgi:transcriptional regulator with XRE-family HTH domain
VQNWGELLRQLRTDAGLTQTALARKTNVAKSTLSMIETGDRSAHVDFALACDQALGTSPLLVMVLGSTGRTTAVDRRAILSAAGMGALGVTPLVHLIRQGFFDDAEIDMDFDALVERYARQFTVASTARFGEALAAQLVVLRQRVKEDPSPDALRAAARLAELYGLWCGNRQDNANAGSWYATAIMLAHRSGDTHLEGYIRARTANRSIFEGTPQVVVRDRVDRVLATTKQATAGTVEAHAAKVCLAALTGNIHAGRRSVDAMRRDLEAITSTDVLHHHERAVFHRAYLESRAGTFADAETACNDAFECLAGLPYWYLETEMYLARAMVVDGDVQQGLAYATRALSTGPEAIGVVRVAVSDVLSVVPPGHETAVETLRPYASTAPGPWETIGA